jgi:flagellar hook-associated protein 2
MSSPIQFSGIGSGLDVDTLVTRLMAVERKPLDQLNTRKNRINLQQTQLDNLGSRLNSLNSAVKRITSAITTDIFNGRSTSVGDGTLLTASAGSTSSPQSLTVDVRRLATATTASSLNPIGQAATSSSNLSGLAQGRITAGNTTVFVGGVANTLAINTTDTIDDVLTRIRGFSGVASATIDAEGKLAVTTQPNTTLQLGATGDTSNFLDLSGLKTGTTVAATPTAGASSTSTRGLTPFNPNGDVTAATSGLATPITADSQFTIGSATFTASAGKTFNALVAEINASADAGVTASYNSQTNKLNLVAKTPGNSLITLKDEGSGNALRALGLIQAGGNTTASQTQGLTAQVSLNNGPVIESSSNTLTDGLTGLTGVTLNLTKANAGQPTNVTIANSTQDLKAALRDVVTQLNSSLNFIQEQTNTQSSTASLKNDGTVLRFRSQIRSALASAAPSGSVNATLSSIGFSTGAASGTGALSTTYSLDETKLDAALAANPQNVQQLLTGPTGIFTQLATLVGAAVDPSTDLSSGGLLAKRKASSTSQIKTINQSIERAQTRLDSKEKLYRQQFQQMDKLISQYQSQSSSINNIGRGIN